MAGHGPLNAGYVVQFFHHKTRSPASQLGAVLAASKRGQALVIRALPRIRQR